MKAIIQNQLIDSVNKEIPQFIEREIDLFEIPNKAYSIIGMRRTGKTYFLYQEIVKHLKNGIDRSRLIYLNFEDERLIDIDIKDMHWIIDEYFVLYPENRSDKVFFFLDEIQLIDKWEVFVRRIMDSENVQVYLSGSSAKMLSREIATSMRGRATETIVYPFSFREFLKFNNIEIPKSYSQIDKNMRSLLENQFIKYLTIGGFPEAQYLKIQERYLLLQSYVNTVVFRDIVERYRVGNIAVLKQLIKHLIRNCAGKFTVNKFYNNLKSNGIKVSKTTLHEYLEYIQDAFLIKNIFVYSQSDRKRMVNPVKTYVIDTGLASSFSLSREPNTGNLLENCIFIELSRRKASVAYFITKSGYEIDFIATYYNKRIDAIQVSADISDKKTLERECRALYEAKSISPDVNLVLINMSQEKYIKYSNCDIHVIPAWKWLLFSSEGFG